MKITPILATNPELARVTKEQTSFPLVVWTTDRDTSRPQVFKEPRGIRLPRHGPHAISGDGCRR
jgi:hypothetical protein